jgi:hypothetical protein
MKTYKPKTEAKTEDKEVKATTTIEVLNARLTAAMDSEKNEREQWKKVVKCIELEREVVTGDTTTVQRIKYPLLFGAYDNFQSVLTSTPPQVVITSDDNNDFVKTVYWRGIIDQQKRKLFLDDLKYEFVQSFIVAGKAVYKVGRKTEIGEVEKEEKGVDGKTIIKTKSEVVTKNESFVNVIDPRKVWVSPETRYTGPILGEECPYVIEEMIKTPEYLEEHYPDLKLDDDEKEYIVDDNPDGETKTADKSETNDDRKRVRLYAYHGVYQKDGKYYSNYMCLFTKKHKVLEKEFPYDHAKKPYIYLLNFRKFFKAKAMGALDSVLDLDQEYNEHMNRIRTYIRRMVNPKWAKTKGTKIDEAALLDPDIGLIVNESTPNAFRPLTPPQLDSSIFEKASAVENLFQFLSSVTYGQSALKQVGTATGQEIASQGADTKTSRMVRLLERGHEELLTMLLQLEQQYAPNEGTSVKIVGSDIVDMIRNKKKLFQVATDLYKNNQMAMQNPQVDEMGQPIPVEPMEMPIDEYENFVISPDGRTVYTKYTREEIKNDFELYIVSQSSNRNQKAVQQAQTLKALELSGVDPTVNRAELWRTYFQNGGENNPDRLVNSNPQPAPVAPGAVPALGNIPTSNTAVATQNKGVI